MGTSTRFVAKNGVDNNSQTIINVSDPSGAQDAATKNYVDTHIVSYTASTGLTLTGSAFSITNVGTAGTYTAVTTNAQGQVSSGTNLSATGDATGTASGSSIALTLATVNASPVTASFVKLTTDAKGRVTATTSVLASDITALIGAVTDTQVVFSSSGTYSGSSSLTWTAGTSTLAATNFSGNGSALTSLNASNLSSGTVNTARLGSGTANSTTYLRGDNTWQTITSGGTPGGSNTQIQYNSSGSFAGSSGLTWTSGTSTLAATNITVSTNLTFGDATVQTTAYPGTAAVGGGSDHVFYENGATVNTDYTITAGKNAMSAGPITIASGVTVTVPAGSTWSVV